MVSGVLQRLLAPGHRVRAQALTGSFLLLSHLSQVLLMLPGTALPLLTDLMPLYPGLMQSTALGEKKASVNHLSGVGFPGWAAPRTAAEGGQARTRLMELLCGRQVDSSSVVFALYVCLGDLTQPPTLSYNPQAGLAKVVFSKGTGEMLGWLGAR